MAFLPSPQQLEDLRRYNEQRALGNYAYGGNIGVTNPATTAFNLSKVTPFHNNPTPQPTQNPVSSPQFTVPSGPSDEELNAIYSPLYSSLSQQEASVRSDTQSQQEMLRQAEKESLDSLGRNKTATLEDIELQKESVNQQLMKATNEAVRSYLALNQQRKSRFGGGSSAGEASSEIIGQEFARGESNIQSEGIKQFGEIRKYSNQVANFFLDEETRIKRDTASQIANVIRQMNQLIGSINTQRNTIESQKAAKRLDARQQAEAYIAEIKNKQLSEQIALERWKEQQDYIVKTNVSQLSESAYKAPTDAVPSTEFSSFSPTTQTSSNYVPSSLRGSNKDDELEFLVDSLA